MPTPAGQGVAPDPRLLYTADYSEAGSFDGLGISMTCCRLVLKLLRSDCNVHPIPFAHEIHDDMVAGAGDRGGGRFRFEWFSHGLILTHG
jgi:hypothetical protein